MASPPDDISVVPDGRDEALRLIGLFVVNFSRYVAHLEHGLMFCVGIGNPRLNMTMWTITSEMEEHRLRSAFFAATAWVRVPTEEERKIRTALNKRGQDLGKSRNAVAHGAWGFASNEGEPILQRFYGKLNEQPMLQSVVASREELADLAQEADEVALLVWEYISGLLMPSDPLGVLGRLGFSPEGVLIRLNG